MSTFLLTRTPLMAKRKIDPNPENNNKMIEQLAKSSDKSKGSKKDSSGFTNREFEEVCEIPEEESIPTETLYHFNTRQLNEQIDFGQSKRAIPVKKSDQCSYYNSTEKTSLKNKLLKSAVPDCASKNKLIDKKKIRDYSPPAYVYQEHEFNIPTNIGLEMANKANQIKGKDTHSLNSNKKFIPISKDKFLKECLTLEGGGGGGGEGFSNNDFRSSINTQADKNQLKPLMSNIKESKHEIDEEEKWNFNADEMNEDSKY